MLYPELRREVCAMNQELPEQGLVVWTGGNVSAIVREAGHVIIKPSGLRFRELTPESMVVTGHRRHHPHAFALLDGVRPARPALAGSADALQPHRRPGHPLYGVRQAGPR